MKFVTISSGIMACAMSASAWAFMPANGLWQIDSESTTGALGRGITLEVENEVVVFTYYGYRADGSSLFYVATGSIANNSFTGDLLNVQGGTSLGGEYKPGTLAASPGKVSLSFSSGKHGSMTLPGEATKAISKFSYGYASGPDGLLGTWLLTSTMSSSSLATRKVLNTKLQATTNGNGIVVTASRDFVCEFQVSGSFAGQVLCANAASTAYVDGYYFKFSGDRGTGVNIYGQTSTTVYEYESHALRTATKTGVKTGLNNGSLASLAALSATVESTSTIFDPASMPMKASAYAGQAISKLDPEKSTALAAWKAEIGVILVPTSR
jgi:hypothetical protein